MFTVAKGEDVRPVFNGQTSGINEIVWVSSLQLPTSSSITGILDYDVKVIDSELGEFFSNMNLERGVQ